MTGASVFRAGVGAVLLVLCAVGIWVRFRPEHPGDEDFEPIGPKVVAGLRRVRRRWREREWRPDLSNVTLVVRLALVAVVVVVPTIVPSSVAMSIAVGLVALAIGALGIVAWMLLTRRGGRP